MPSGFRRVVIVLLSGRRRERVPDAPPLTSGAGVLLVHYPEAHQAPCTWRPMTASSPCAFRGTGHGLTLDLGSLLVGVTTSPRGGAPSPPVLAHRLGMRPDGRKAAFGEMGDQKASRRQTRAVVQTRLPQLVSCWEPRWLVKTLLGGTDTCSSMQPVPPGTARRRPRSRCRLQTPKT